MTALTRIVLGSIIAFSLVIESITAQTSNSPVTATAFASPSPASSWNNSARQGKKKQPTPLHWVAFQGDVIQARQLIGAGANVDRQVESGSTPLHLAAYKGHTDVMELLIENGADINMRTIEGVTALDWAKRNGHEAAIALLLDHGAVAGKPFTEESAIEFQRRKAMLEQARPVGRINWLQERPAPVPASAEPEEDYSDVELEVDLERLDSVARVNRLLANYRPEPAAGDTKDATDAAARVHTGRHNQPAAAGFRIQLASFRNERRALRAREQFQGNHPDILAEQELVLETFQSGNTQYHRVRSGQLPKHTALSLCEQLNRRDQACILVR